MNQGTKGQFKVGRLVADTIRLGGTLITATAAQLNTVSSLAKPLNFQGVIDCSANPNYPAATAGDVYRVSVGGKIGGGSGPTVQANDSLICITTAVAGTHAAVGSSWYIEQGNIVSTADVPASTDKNYVTDAQAVVIGNTSGTNTGDEVVATGAEVDTGTDDVKYASPKAIADSKVAKGVAAGYRVARSAAPVALDGANPTSVAHGLTTCVSANVSLAGSGAPGAGTSTLSVVINGANLDVYGWKPTTGGAAGNPDLIASDGTETFHWIAVGT